jgi:hypothetical protein
MIICAAVKIQVEGLDHETIIPCRRHGDAFQILKDLGYAPRTKYKEIAQGFIDNSGKFYNRKDALIQANTCGQLSKSTLWYKKDHYDFELYSEDLY